MLQLRSLVDDAKCYETVRQLRWPDGVRCAHCDASEVTKQGLDETQAHRQRYLCKACGRRFDDLTTATGSAKFTSTPSRASGRCCARGCDHTAGSPRRACPCIWASSSSSTTPSAVAAPCSMSSSVSS